MRPGHAKRVQDEPRRQRGRLLLGAPSAGDRTAERCQRVHESRSQNGAACLPRRHRDTVRATCVVAIGHSRAPASMTCRKSRPSSAWMRMCGFAIVAGSIKTADDDARADDPAFAVGAIVGEQLGNGTRPESLDRLRRADGGRPRRSSRCRTRRDRAVGLRVSTDRTTRDAWTPHDRWFAIGSRRASTTDAQPDFTVNPTAATVAFGGADMTDSVG